MTDPIRTAARARVAATAGLTALLGYVLTLAPTVSLWDSGEFIAAAKDLGVPHPPGSPLFVLLAHTWAALLPLGTFAWRVNLFSAVAGAATVAFLALACFEILRRRAATTGAEAGAVAAALVAGFTLTHWQNSNETEVYSIATAMVGAVLWLVLLWRGERDAAAAPGATPGPDRPSRYLLLILYIFGLAVGDHLLTLLAGPAVVAFLWAEERRVSVEVAVVAAVWAVLVAVMRSGSPRPSASATLAEPCWYTPMPASDLANRR